MAENKLYISEFFAEISFYTESNQRHTLYGSLEGDQFEFILVFTEDDTKSYFCNLELKEKRKIEPGDTIKCSVVIRSRIDHRDKIDKNKKFWILQDKKVASGKIESIKSCTINDLSPSELKLIKTGQEVLKEFGKSGSIGFE